MAVPSVESAFDLSSQESSPVVRFPRVRQMFGTLGMRVISTADWVRDGLSPSEAYRRQIAERGLPLDDGFNPDYYNYAKSALDQEPPRHFMPYRDIL